MTAAEYQRRFAQRWVWFWPGAAALLLLLQTIGLWTDDGNWIGAVGVFGLVGVATAGWAGIRLRSWWCGAAVLASVALIVLAGACWGWEALLPRVPP